MKDLKNKDHIKGRREFLSMVSVAAAMGLMGSIGEDDELPADKEVKFSQPANPMPTITLGKHTISRLISGSNPMLGYSYMGPFADRAMKEYFTRERVIQFHESCERAGITAHQMSYVPDDTHQLPKPGSDRQIICLMSGTEKIDDAVKLVKPIALSHHGGVTDRLFAEGKSGIVHNFVKAVKDKGILAGVSAHNPDCIKRIADEDWDVDFFMTCFYFLTRKTAGKEADVPTLEISYPFFKDDPKIMIRVIQQVKQPCLAFKILGAGRRCSSQEMVQSAFKFAFDNIKPTDGIIVGMCPWYYDQISANAQYARELGRHKS